MRWVGLVWCFCWLSFYFLEFLILYCLVFVVFVLGWNFEVLVLGLGVCGLWLLVVVGGLVGGLVWFFGLFGFSLVLCWLLVGCCCFGLVMDSGWGWVIYWWVGCYLVLFVLVTLFYCLC